MPKRHGLFKDQNTPPTFLIGIKCVFDAVCSGPFASESYDYYKQGNATYLPAHVEFHFGKICDRFLDSLDLFQRHFVEFGQFLNECNSNSLIGENMPREAPVAADSIFAYLSAFIEDIGRIVPFLFLKGPKEPKFGSVFSALQGAVLGSSVFDSLKPLFLKLEQEGSWWKTAFKSGGEGVRHRLVHYPDLIAFQGVGTRKGTNLKPQAILYRPGHPDAMIDFEEELRLLLKGLCE